MRAKKRDLPHFVEIKKLPSQLALSDRVIVIVINTINDHDIVAPEQDHDHVTKSIQIFL